MYDRDCRKRNKKNKCNGSFFQYDFNRLLRHFLRQQRRRCCRRRCFCNDSLKWIVFGSLVLLLIISQLGIPLALLILLIALVLIIYN